MKPILVNNVFPTRNLADIVHAGAQGWGESSPPLHPLPLPKRDPGAGRIVVKVAQDPTPLHSGDGAPTGAVRGRSAKRGRGTGRGRYYRWETCCEIELETRLLFLPRALPRVSREWNEKEGKLARVGECQERRESNLGTPIFPREGERENVRGRRYP